MNSYWADAKRVEETKEPWFEKAKDFRINKDSSDSKDDTNAIETKIHKWNKSLTNKRKHNHLKVQKLLPLFKNEEIIRNGEFTEYQKEVLTREEIKNNYELLWNLQNEFRKINKRALTKREGLSAKEYTILKLKFDAWISTWSQKIRCATKYTDLYKLHRNRIRGAERVLVQWVLYDAKEDYSYLVTFVQDKIMSKNKAQENEKS